MVYGVGEVADMSNICINNHCEFIHMISNLILVNFQVLVQSKVKNKYHRSTKFFAINKGT